VAIDTPWFLWQDLFFYFSLWRFIPKSSPAFKDVYPRMLRLDMRALKHNALESKNLQRQSGPWVLSPPKRF
jgi:hypothetical protein